MTKVEAIRMRIAAVLRECRYPVSTGRLIQLCGGRIPNEWSMVWHTLRGMETMGDVERMKPSPEKTKSSVYWMWRKT